MNAIIMEPKRAKMEAKGSLWYHKGAITIPMEPKRTKIGAKGFLLYHQGTIRVPEGLKAPKNVSK
jgi:hypothetical protein